ncbi:putative dehydrogenase [Halovivax ruber XH-70]|uniref:Putative dehydrogenase n=1 Tax=Halovivax ruber (strain DSM 18193 / JCM 13892 / XH-70) TaxID=797302 RepID=L0IBK3_HALRX|nr:Gfo/Idh/MocA family oxidoreductase [Halovivax ruber]AGB15626.1 putative dehydrogenase [Halovivax ruber XH-70]
MTVRTGVIGVGSMGRHHARIYDQMLNVELIGVTDVDTEAAKEVADQRDTAVFDRGELLDRVDAVSIAVPTPFHYEIARECIDAGVDVLVEKPFVAEPERGELLVERAAANDVLLQVGHVERFNPAVVALREVIQDLDVISLDARRLGPTPDRQIDDSVVMDLMIHDLDIVNSIVGGEPGDVSVAGSRAGKHATTTITFPDETIATLTASRVTQEKIRQLTITAEECYVKVDYLDQSIDIHRQSVPEYVVTNGDVRFRHESIVERPVVDNTEPLKNELSSFTDAVRTRSQPVVTGEDGLRAVFLARNVDERAFPDRYA